MDFRVTQIAPPKDWNIFEELCLGLFRVIWRNPLAVRHGRSGQAQHGVDIFGSPEGQEIQFYGVQCKGKDQAYGHRPTLSELNSEITKAEHFTPALSKFIFATTAPRDASLQRAAHEISRKRAAAGKFTVDVLAWEDIQSLLADAEPVLQAFYPEHAINLQSVIAALRDLPTSSEASDLRETLRSLTTPAAATIATWRPVRFATKRDLGPALMGRALGPADALACPLLPEAAALIHDLQLAYSARLSGEAGFGKSVCAYQAAHSLAMQGWQVLALEDPKVADVALPSTHIPTLYLIDDAHLMSSAVLASAEAQTTNRRWLLSTHNVAEQGAAGRGAIKLDAKRAVRVIAAQLRANLPATLAVVQRVDDWVGDRPLAESLALRIDHAESEADRPWQFCFILGGGWRRASQSANNARAEHADIVLAAAAIRQIASRDARCSREEMLDFLKTAGIASPESAMRWLLQERLLIAPHDCRTPHQRFAAVVIDQILRAQDDKGRHQIAALYGAALQSPEMPLIGLQNLISEFSRYNFGQFKGLVSAAPLQPALARCWHASDAERAGALFLLSAASAYLPGWPKDVLDGHRALLVEWVSQAARQSCFALGRLLQDVSSADKAYAEALLGEVSPRRISAVLASVAPANAYEMGALLSALAHCAPKVWRKKLKSALPRAALLTLARRWPGAENIASFAKLALALSAYDNALALDMVAAFAPHAARALAANPAQAYAEFDDVAWHLIKGFDPLGAYQKYPQTRRERALCRKICTPLNAMSLAAKLSETDKRDFQSAAHFLGFLRNSAPRKFAQVVRAIDWDRISQSIGADWKHLNHEAEILFWIAYRDPVAKRTVAALVEQRLPEIEVLTAKLAIVAPIAAHKQIAAGGRIGLASPGGHFHWVETFLVVAELTEARPDLMPKLLATFLADASQTLSQEHPSWYRDGALLIRLLRQVAPDSVQKILDGVDAAKAEKGWSAALTSSDDMRRPIALLIESALAREDAIGALAKRLRAQFGVSSEPGEDDLKDMIT